jgi:hypothetical protein
MEDGTPVLLVDTEDLLRSVRSKDCRRRRIAPRWEQVETPEKPADESACWWWMIR